MWCFKLKFDRGLFLFALTIKVPYLPHGSYFYLRPLPPLWSEFTFFYLLISPSRPLSPLNHKEFPIISVVDIEIFSPPSAVGPPNRRINGLPRVHPVSMRKSRALFPFTKRCKESWYETEISYAQDTSLAGFWKALPPIKTSFAQEFFFFTQSSANVTFSPFSSFLSPCSFFLFFPLHLLVWYSRLSGEKNPAFWAFSIKWLQIS